MAKAVVWAALLLAIAMIVSAYLINGSYQITSDNGRGGLRINRHTGETWFCDSNALTCTPFRGPPNP
jgi:hypothetical protein